MSDGNIWTDILERLKGELDPEEYRRGFLASSYASDSGDVISIETFRPNASAAR